MATFPELHLFGLEGLPAGILWFCHVDDSLLVKVCRKLPDSHSCSVGLFRAISFATVLFVQATKCGFFKLEGRGTS